MQLGNRYSQHSFAQVPQVNMARSSFDRSSTMKTTMDFDKLTPVFVDEIIPGDTMNLNLKAFCRLATQLVPVMDNMYMDFHFFFVPNRLVWENWEKFNGAQDNPGDSTDYLVPVLTAPAAPGFLIGSIFDQMGLPTGIASIPNINVLPFRAYNLIYNEWYRDQNLETSTPVPKDDGPDVSTFYDIQFRNKAHDYFTSALPWPQKGPAVELPLGTYAPVVPNSPNTGFNLTGNNGAAGVTNRFLQVGTGAANLAIQGANATATTGIVWGDTTGLRADLSTATAATINQLREAFMMQSLFELDARGGTRYVEILAAHFNVTSPDFRLQRPEYLGGGRINFNVHTVAQTSESATSPQANLAGFGTAMAGSDSNIGFTKSFVEHGYVLGIASARADITYQQGLNKMWSRRTRYDFFWPKLQELGEQAILRKEIYCINTSQDNQVFGYQERYGEYRNKLSEIRGLFRSTAANSLDVWHMAEEFSGVTVGLNADFMISRTPIQRSMAVTTEPPILMDAWFELKHARPMVAYSTPATIGRF